MLQHAIAAIAAGHGLFLLDPHGEDVDRILDYIPPRRRNQVVLLDPTAHIVAFNPLDRVADIDQSADALLYALRDIWRFSKASTAVFDAYVLHALATLMQVPGTTLLHIGPLLRSRLAIAERCWRRSPIRICGPSGPSMSG